MRKRFLITFISAVFVLFQGQSADEEEDKRGVIVNNQSDMLEKITEKVPGIREVIDQCEKSLGSYKTKDECVWDQVDQEAVLTALDEYSDGVKAPDANDEDAPQYEYKLDNFKLKKSKPVEKLEAYLKKRLEEALYGKDQSGNKLKVAKDHSDFYRIWQSQLGKNLIVQLSNYCMYSNPSSGLVPFGGSKVPSSTKSGSVSLAKINTDQAALFFQKLNLKSLKEVQSTKDGDQSAAYSGFSNCISRISLDCRKGDGASEFDDYDLGENKKVTFNRYDLIPGITKTEDLFNEISKVSKTEAEGISSRIPHPCEVNRYMTGVKGALENAEFLVSEMSKRREAGFAVANIQQRENLNTDKVVNISSGELLQDEDYKEAVQEETAKLEECSKNGVNEECEVYLSDIEESKKINDEAFIRGLALKKKMEANLTGKDADPDIDELKKYFLDKGMSEENFEIMLAQEIEKENKTSGTRKPKEILKDLISEYYDNERKAIERSLKDRLEKTTKADPTSGSTNQTKIGNIKAQIESSPEELAVLYHYSNVVSAFIKVTSGGDESGRNTAALAAELENNHFDPSNASGRGTASSSGKLESNLENLQDFAGSDSTSSGESSGAVLGAKEIDQIQFGINSNADKP